MKKILLVLVLSTVGCAKMPQAVFGPDTKGDPATMPWIYADSTPFLQAVWAGNVTIDGVVKKVHFNLGIVQGEFAGGDFEIDYGHDMHGKISGTLKGANFDFVLDQGNGCFATYSGTAVLSGHQMDLSFSGIGNATPCRGPIVSAQGTLYKNGIVQP